MDTALLILPHHFPFNSYPVLRFAMPKAVLEGLYTPRRDWKADITHLPPFLLIAGTNDEVFHSEAYEPAITPLNPNGTYRLVPDTTHLEIPDAPEPAEAVVGFVRGGEVGTGQE